jgi:two-component system, NarL family, sensor histidine kinase UhpB
MFLFKSLQTKVLVLFVSYTIAFAAIIFFIFPLFHLDALKIHSALFIIIVFVFIIFSAVLLYFFVFHYNKRLKKEKDSTAEIINRYEALGTATSDAIWDHDLNTGETFYNERVMQIFGYNKKDLKDNKTWWDDNIHPEDKQRVQQKINSILDESIALWKDEYRFRCKDGTYKIVRDRSYIVRDKNNKPIRLIGAMNDITIEKTLEEKLVQEKLEHKNRLGKAIIQAHEEERKRLREELHEDVNQLLAYIKLCIHQFKNKQGGEQAMAEGLTQLDNAINKIRKISNQLAPSGLDTFGLISSMKDLLIYNENLHKIKIGFNYEFFRESRVDSSYRIFIYRLVQDYLENSFSDTQVSPANLAIILENENTDTQIVFIESNLIKDINSFTNQRRLKDIQNKLDMYNGRIQVSYNENKETIVKISL